MMRAARFAAQLGFAPGARGGRGDDGDGRPDRASSPPSGCATSCPSCCWPTGRGRGLDLLVRTGLADRVLPELPALRLERDEHHRHKDVYEHSLTVLEQAIELEAPAAADAGPDLVNRLAALLHDVGKPATRKFEAGGKVSFHHHDVVGAKLVRKRLTALRFSSDEVVKAVSELVVLHLRFHGYGDTSAPRASGPTPPSAATSATPATSWSGCTS